MKLCIKNNCGNKVQAKSMCHTHYVQLWRSGSSKIQKMSNVKCSELGCEIRSGRSGFCRKHYMVNYIETNKTKLEVQKSQWHENNKDSSKALQKLWRNENRHLLRSKNAKRRASEYNAKPKWVNKLDLNLVYKDCPVGMAVDHIIPLVNEYICGLHIPQNLQYLTVKENSTKSNKFDGTNENESWKQQLNERKAA